MVAILASDATSTPFHSSHWEQILIALAIAAKQRILYYVIEFSTSISPICTPVPPLVSIGWKGTDRKEEVSK